MPEIAVQQFEYIISVFLSFVNKRKFKKLKELRKSQASLPIAASKDEILRTLEEHQVMILAGDTGCGKSTQVGGFDELVGERLWKDAMYCASAVR